MKDNFDHHAWKLNQLHDDAFATIASDGFLDENGDELTVKDEDDYRGERRFNSDDIRYVAKKLGVQVNNDFGGRTYDFNYYKDLEPVFDNLGIELDHDDSMDVS